MSVATYRVGVHQFLVLGALAQHPTGSMSAKDLADHFRGWRKHFSLSPVIGTLLDRGCIATNGSMNVYRITSYGEMALCNRTKGRPEVFLKLDANIIERQGVTCLPS